MQIFLYSCTRYNAIYLTAWHNLYKALKSGLLMKKGLLYIVQDETSSEQFLEEKSHTLRIIMKLVFF